MYIFGGTSRCLHESNKQMTTNELIVFDLKRGTFAIKPVEGQRPTPRDKSVSWMDGGKFFVFGGFGPGPYMIEQPEKYFLKLENFLEDCSNTYYRPSWNNQLLCIDEKLSQWTEIEQGGSVPSPRAAASAAFVAPIRKVFLFGGRHGPNRLNDLYEMDSSSFIWTQIDLLCVPQGRSWATFTPLPDLHKIIMFGGLADQSEESKSLGDLYELDLSAYYDRGSSLEVKLRPRPMWNRISRTDHRLPERLWHTGIFVDSTLLLYGGMCRLNPQGQNQTSFARDRTLLFRQIQPQRLQSISLHALVDAHSSPAAFNTLKSVLPKNLQAHLHLLHCIKSLNSGTTSPPPKRMHIGEHTYTSQNDLVAFIESIPSENPLLYLFNAFDV